MEKINSGGPYKVTVKSPYTFEIDCDTREFGAYDVGGYCTQVNVPFDVSFKAFETSLQQPYCYEQINGKPVRMMMHNPDMMKWERAE